MSQQYWLLHKLYTAHKDRIDQVIIREADKWLDEGHKLDKTAKRPYSHWPKYCIFSDGAFDPFISSWQGGAGDTPQAKEYNKYCGEHGGGNDDTFYLTSIWERVLAFENYAKYEYIIKTFLDIDVNGL